MPLTSKKATRVNRRVIQALLLLVALALITTESVAAEELVDAMPCHVNVIRWVDLHFEGTAEELGLRKAKLEKLIRLRLRNDLSLIDHDYMSESEFLVQTISGKTNKREGRVSCDIWTVGDDYPISFLLECKMLGLGHYDKPFFSEITAKVLGYTSRQKASNSLDESIRSAITDLSAQFLEARGICKRGSP